MDEQQHFRGQVLWQRYPRVMDKAPETTTEGSEPEDSCTFRILTVHPVEPGQKDLAVKCKSFPDWDPDDLFEFHGKMVDSEYGPTFEAEQAVRVIPDTVRGIQKYLENHVKGVGKKTAAILMAKFGADIINVLDNSPERLTECAGIGADKADKIVASWRSQHDPVLRQLELWLARFDIGSSWGKKFLAAFGQDAIPILEKNPYRSMKLSGIGFKKADEMAARMGWPERCPERTEGAVTYSVSEAISRGHCFLEHNELMGEVRKNASSRKGTNNENEQLPMEDAQQAITRVVERKHLIREPVKIKGISLILYYLPVFYAAEKRLAQRIGELQSFPHVAPRDIESTLERVEKDLGQEPNEQQRQAVIAALRNNLSILTGGPGTGKTTTLKMLLRTAARLGLNVELCAPTGRAAKRMAEVTGQEAQTVHKLLEWSYEDNDFQRNKKNPLNCSLLICDEASMLDLQLADSLMDAVPDSCSVVFVGDVDQLPSVGPGMILRDMINCQKIQVTKLETIFRQAENSLIIRNAHKIRTGQMPIFPDVKKGQGIEADSYFMEVPKGPEGKDDLEWIKAKLPPVIQRIVAKHGVDPIRDIQILTPMRIGVAGAIEFNKVLQETLNPHGKEVAIKGHKFRIGDRVMQLANNYQQGMEISNGDIGFIKEFDETHKEIVIDFYGRLVRYPFRDTDDLALSYAATTHKSQGSEFEIVILLMTMHHYPMLERNLLYTANTRAKKMIVFLASWPAVKRAVEQCNVNGRHTFLVQRICIACKEVKTAALPVAA